uniref:DNA polymerase III polC-type n=1 Tax=Anthurium amnicola TaxID=1678845 RepID=A0A1D1XX95_9ARAE
MQAAAATVPFKHPDGDVLGVVATPHPQPPAALPQVMTFLPWWTAFHSQPAHGDQQRLSLSSMEMESCRDRPPLSSRQVHQATKLGHEQVVLDTEGGGNASANSNAKFSIIRGVTSLLLLHNLPQQSARCVFSWAVHMLSSCGRIVLTSDFSPGLF